MPPRDGGLRHAYLPSLLDRLQDDAPQQRSEPPEAYAPDERGMRRIIQRDLGLLLNTTNLNEELDAGAYPEVANSVVNYGIPPLSGGFATEMTWERLEERVRTAIARFEPRLIPDTVRLRPLRDASARRYNKMMFEIEALMQWTPYPLEFRIQSVFDLELSKVSLQSGHTPGSAG
ncbi:type VI secretion system baseplate subunit TssE [Cupriavidus sp. 2KB_3]|uniref:type VI secretion system baseplate subunit TssE n=1 Tax=Cupriavidus sp. 2KB_3 TaxID=3232980 RepID=UPI003F91A77B